MSKRLIATAFLAVCYVWLFSETSYGQIRPPGLRINRPTDRGPSHRLGRTGGIYTGRYDRGPVNRGPRGLSDTNFYGAANEMARMPTAPLPQAFLGFQTGYTAYRAPQPMFESPGGVSNEVLGSVSLLDRSMSPVAPLMPRRWELQFPDRPFYVPEPEGTPFHKFFGLEPPKPQATGAIIETEGMVGALMHANAAQLELMRTRAENSFRAAMTPDARDRESKLSEAQLRLLGLRDLDSSAYVPCLLAVHTSLERGLRRQALHFLVDAVVRNPLVFSELTDLAQYYGDYDPASRHSDLLERQMVRNLRIGEEHPEDPGGFALQAYCAWILKDQARVRAALELMDEAARRGALGGKALIVRDALAAAMK